MVNSMLLLLLLLLSTLIAAQIPYSLCLTMASLIEYGMLEEIFSRCKEKFMESTKQSSKKPSEVLCETCKKNERVCYSMMPDCGNCLFRKAFLAYEEEVTILPK